MKITNKFGVPETIVALANRDSYSKGKSDFSVTEIISPPRIQLLRRKHYAQMETDVSDLLWSMMGTALHVVAERSQVDNHTNEERLFLEIDGVVLSGAIDLQYEEDGCVQITDYKFTSAWSVMNDKPEWEIQQNIYAWMVSKVKGKHVNSVRICALIRDWNRREAQRKQDYPQAPIQIVNLRLWTPEETEEYVRSRLELHRVAKVLSDWGDELPECTEEDKWIRETKYAVKKAGRKTAVRVFDSEAEAKEFMNGMIEKDKGFIEVRKGEPVRCTGNFCGVNQWCSQYQTYLKEQENVGIQEAE
jgi:hypothetical protein